LRSLSRSFWCFIASGRVWQSWFSNYNGRMKNCFVVVFVSILFVCVLLSWFFASGINLLKTVAKSCVCQWIVFCWSYLNWVLFHNGLLSFNKVCFCLLTPGGSGNKVFKNSNEYFLSAVFVYFAYLFVFSSCVSSLLALIFRNLLRNRAFVNGLWYFVGLTPID
jgi:hypothetical protein